MSSTRKIAVAAGRLFPDLVWLNLSLLASWWCCQDTVPGLTWADFIKRYLVCGTLIAAAALIARRVHRLNPRYVGLYDQINLSIAAALTTAGLLLLNSLDHEQASLGFVLLSGFFFLSAITGRRVVSRMVSWRHSPFQSAPKDSLAIRTLIVGAGDAGEFVLRELGRDRGEKHLVMGFVDDAPQKQSLIIQGVRVLGTLDQIPMLATNLDLDEIVICIPTASGSQMRRIHALCSETKCRIRTVPSLQQLLVGPKQARLDLREIRVEDLLRREPAQVDEARVRGLIQGESILITGGGGSIGSELARQVANHNPARLTLLGKGENSLYEIEQELLHRTPFVPNCVVCDVRDRASMRYAFEKTRPTTIFHAAAHKHVPLMQSNPIEAIRNNVFGTLTAVQTAMEYGAKRFVLISTDKAVNPTSVMGASKRVAEMIVAAHAQQSDTDFAIVRFGNVLGSRGSLIPLLQKQIAFGGPIKITHPDMERFFMTIPEAVQLILEASGNGRNGEIFILDMGDPIKIVDLAYDLIRLHGLEPERDIEVKFIGPRPGEKLYEELTYSAESLQPTSHPRVNQTSPIAVSYDQVMGQILTLNAICESGDQERAQQYLMEMALASAEAELSMPGHVVVESDLAA